MVARGQAALREALVPLIAFPTSDPGAGAPVQDRRARRLSHLFERGHV